MLLSPKKTKFRKYQKGRIPYGISQRANLLQNSGFGLKSIEPGRITSKQIEAARRVIARKTKRSGVLLISVFPDIGKSKKPSEIRMGKGKGPIDQWITKIKSGRIIYELNGVEEIIATDALLAASFKLPIKTKIVSLSREL